MKSLARLNKYFWKYKWRLFLGIIFAILSSAFLNVFIPVLVGQATDFMKIAYQQGISLNNTIHILFLFGIKIIAITLVGGVFMFLMRQAIIVMSRHIEYDLKNDIFSHYQKLDISFFRKNNTGDLMNRISEDVSRVRMYIGPAIMYFANTLATLILVPMSMSFVNTKLTLFVLLPLPLLVVVIYFVSELINKMSNNVQMQLSNLSTIAQETFSGIRVLKAYAQEEPTGSRFAIESNLYRKKYMGLTITEALFGPFILLLMGLSTQMAIYFGGLKAIAGVISLGNIVQFIMYVGKLTWPVASLGWVTSLVQRAAASQSRINEFLAVESELKNSEKGKGILNSIKGNLKFQNVTFKYPNGIFALKNISFEIPEGKTFAIVGRTGSGKTSIANIICRLYDVQDGKVLIDGISIDDFNLSLLRSQIGYVPQDTFLFSDTIGNNIGFGLSGEFKDMNLIEQAAKDAGIYAEIMCFPNKFDTVIGERGITLSGGQKQRIAIARAIIGAPRILIFDDCLSAVDTETEVEILCNLKRIMQNRTTIIISHRVSSVKEASTILVLENGAIKEEGTHAELLRTKGVYNDLYLMQLMEAQEQR